MSTFIQFIIIVNCRHSTRLQEILRLGNFVADVKWLNFLSLACTALEGNLTDAVTLLCKILTKDPEGGKLYAGLRYLRTWHAM